MHNYRSLIRKPRERRQFKHNARTKLPPAATKCKCTTTGHCFNLQVQHATMPSTTGALRSSCVLTSKCDTELQAEIRCHDAVEPLLFPALLHGMRNKNCHTSIYEYQDRLPKKTAPYHDVEDLTCSPNKLGTVMQWMTLVARLSLYSETVNKCKQRITKARKRMHIMMARMTPFSLHFARCTDSPCSIEPVKIPCLTDHSSLARTSRWMDSNSGSLAQRASDTTD